ncbi:MAG: DUF3592 domain-containing protein [Chloroflexota bacterium]
MDSSGLSFLASLLGVIALGILSIYCAWSSARAWGKSSLLDTRGEHTRGKVTALKVRHMGRGTRYSVTYRFSAQNKLQRFYDRQQEQQISARHYNRFHTGDRVEVVYLPRKSDISRLVGAHLDNTTRDTATFFLIIAIVLSPSWPLAVFVWLITFLVVRFNYPANR